MILIDDRIGSKDLLGALQRYGAPAELTRLEFADAAFVGRGIADAPVTVGIELKETQDLLSSLQSGRFSGHQLPGLLSTYDRVWLVTEGIWRSTKDGVLETLHRGKWRHASHGRKRIMTSDLESWLLTQTIRGGIGHWHASTRVETIRFIATLYHWWTDCAISEHRSHQQIYLPPPDRATFIEPSTFRKMLSCIPKVGWDKSAALEAKFDSMYELMLASEDELQEIDGIGKVVARNIRRAIDS